MAQYHAEVHMVRAIIKKGRVEVQDPIPADWEGRSVNIAVTTEDGPLPDLDARLASLHALGPMEYDAEERDAIAAALFKLNSISKAAMESVASNNA